MAKGMKLLTFAFAVSFLLLWGAYCLWGRGLLLSLCITAGVVLYHLAMRLLVGYAVNGVLHNQVDYHRAWFRPRSAEGKIYRFLRVKQWGKHLPTYDPSAFSKQEHSWEEILGAGCQAEIVHELIVLFSFLPLVLAIPFGEFFLFFFTSLASALFDGSFVILQRYHRPRLLRVAQRNKK